MIILDDDLPADEKDPLLGLDHDITVVLPPLPAPEPIPPAVGNRPTRRWWSRWWWLIPPGKRKAFSAIARTVILVALTATMFVLLFHMSGLEIVPRNGRPVRFQNFLPWGVPPPFLRHRRFQDSMRPPKSGAKMGTSFPKSPPPPLPPPTMPIRLGLPIFCNLWQNQSTSLNAKLVYSLNDTKMLSVSTIGNMQGSLRLEVADRLNAEVEVNVSGERAGLNACLLENEGGGQGIGVWGPPYMLANDGAGVQKNCTSGTPTNNTSVDSSEPAPTVDLVLRLPSNSSLRTFDAVIPSLSLSMLLSLSNFTFDEVVIFAGGSIMLDGVQASRLQAFSTGGSIKGEFSAVETFLHMEEGAIWTNITIAAPASNLAPSVTLVTQNAPIIATISSARQGLNVTTSTTNATVDVAYCF